MRCTLAAGVGAPEPPRPPQPLGEDAAANAAQQGAGAASTVQAGTTPPEEGEEEEEEDAPLHVNQTGRRGRRVAPRNSLRRAAQDKQQRGG